LLICCSVVRKQCYCSIFLHLYSVSLSKELICDFISQADKLVSKSTFPTLASTNAWARYLYYTGIIKAIQLDYSEAHKNLLQAIRKAPQNSAYGFKQTVSHLYWFFNFVWCVWECMWTQKHKLEVLPFNVVNQNFSANVSACSNISIT